MLTHVARNADGMRRMADGAARGEVVDQYVGGVEGRAAAIEAGARRPAAELVADLERSATALAAAWDAMPAGAWDNVIRPLRGEALAHEGPGFRVFEVEVHHVDLGCGYEPADWPAGFVELGLERVVRVLRGHTSTIGPPATWRLVRTDGGGEVTVRRDLHGTTVALGPLSDHADAVVRATGCELLAWLLGRGDGPPGEVEGDTALAAELPARYPWQ